ncbi:unnamed protein product [Linum tenue]|uniref:KOW domain-containing protein n=1 Tax=Linum tenue TaxID=586396 RepID=A0AAV0H5B7_9ROSI|nr:unnamed protein product [Linum tenue]
MAAQAALQASMASLSISSSSFFGDRLSFPCTFSPLTVKSPDKPCLIVVKLKRWERKECKPNSLPILHKMHVKVGDTVKVIAGDDKGKVGEIKKIFRHNSTVVVNDINLKTKHMKSREQDEPGQIIVHILGLLVWQKLRPCAKREDVFFLLLFPFHILLSLRPNLTSIFAYSRLKHPSTAQT